MDCKENRHPIFTFLVFTFILSLDLEPSLWWVLGVGHGVVGAGVQDAMTASDRRGIGPCGSRDLTVVPRRLKGSDDSG
jgi:hypothetical protein